MTNVVINFLFFILVVDIKTTGQYIIVVNYKTTR